MQAGSEGQMAVAGPVELDLVRVVEDLVIGIGRPERQ